MPKTMLCLEPCFKDRDLFLRTLQDFYSVLIKSSPQDQTLIGRIAGTAAACHSILSQNENLLADLLLSRLACFASEKKFWLVKVFGECIPIRSQHRKKLTRRTCWKSFHQRELAFLASLTHSSPHVCGIPSLCALTGFAGHRTKAPDTIFSGTRRPPQHFRPVPGEHSEPVCLQHDRGFLSYQSCHRKRGGA